MMTAKINMLYVILEDDIKISEIEPLMNAILHMKGVLEVKQNIKTVADDIAYTRIRQEFLDKFIKILS